MLAGDPPIAIYLPPDRATYDSLAPGAPDWSGAITFPDRDRIVLPIAASSPDQPPLRTILVHELAHVALRRYLGSGVPRWFHEGYAQLASGSWSGSQAWRLRFAILAGRIPSLDRVDLEFSGQRIGAEQAYLLAYTAVDALYRMGGSDGFRYLLERWHDGGDLDRAVRETYGITLHEFERLWRNQVRDRYGWLLMLTQVTAFWLLLTILLLGLGYWKIRRNRRKLAELKAREVLAPPVEPTDEQEDVGSLIDETERQT